MTPESREPVAAGSLGDLSGLLRAFTGGSEAAPASGLSNGAIEAIVTTLGGVIAGQREEIRWWRERYCRLEERYEQCDHRAAEAQEEGCGGGE